MSKIKKVSIKIVVLIIIFIFSYFVGKSIKLDDNTQPNLTTENILESIKYKLDAGWHKYNEWNKKEIYETKIECKKDNHIIVKVNFEDYGDIYFELLKDGNYYTMGGFGDEEYWQNYCK